MTCGAVTGWVAGVAVFRDLFCTGVLALPRRAVTEPFERVGLDVFRVVLGGGTFRAGEAFAGRGEGLGFFPAVLGADFVVVAATFRGVEGETGTAFRGFEPVDPLGADVAGPGFSGAATLGFGGAVRPGAGVVRTLDRGGVLDGFPEDLKVLERDGRGFWGISAELGIRQASRWGSGGPRVDPPR